MVETHPIGSIDMTDNETEEQSAGDTPSPGDNPAAERAGIHKVPPPEEIEKIEAEREERLDPANRPDNAEVDNTDRTFEDGGFKD